MLRGFAVRQGLCQRCNVSTDELPGKAALPVSVFGIRSLLCICAWGWSSRASLNLLPDGCEIAPADPRAELLPKHWQNQRLLQWVARLIKPSGCSEPSRAVAYVFIHTSLLLCSTSPPIIESYPDILHYIKIWAIHISHSDNLQTRFSRSSSRPGTIYMWLQVIPQFC